MSKKKFGVLKDIKEGEFRVVMTPAEAAVLVEDGVEVYVSSGAGERAGSTSVAYAKALLPHFRSILKDGLEGRELDPAPSATKTVSDCFYEKIEL